MSTIVLTRPARSSRRTVVAPAPRAVFVRRRLVAALIVATVLVGGAVRAVAAGGVGPASDTSRRPAAYVVQPGDTVWSIVRQYRPTGDITALVRELTERNGGPDLQVGQQLLLAG